MAEEVLVEKKLELGERLIRELQARDFDVSAAFWMQEDGGLWYLYLATSVADDLGTYEAYKKLNALLRQLNVPLIDPFEIKIIRTSEPVTAEVLEITNRPRANVYARHSLHKLGGLRSGDAHIYPLNPVP